MMKKGALYNPVNFSIAAVLLCAMIFFGFKWIQQKGVEKAREEHARQQAAIAVQQVENQKQQFEETIKEREVTEVDLKNITKDIVVMERKFAEDALRRKLKRERLISELGIQTDIPGDEDAEIDKAIEQQEADVPKIRLFDKLSRKGDQS